jgi:hypothetical protein
MKDSQFDDLCREIGTLDRRALLAAAGGGIVAALLGRWVGREAYAQFTGSAPCDQDARTECEWQAEQDALIDVTICMGTLVVTQNPYAAYICLGGALTKHEVKRGRCFQQGCPGGFHCQYDGARADGTCCPPGTTAFDGLCRGGCGVCETWNGTSCEYICGPCEYCTTFFSPDSPAGCTPAYNNTVYTLCGPSNVPVPTCCPEDAHCCPWTGGHKSHVCCHTYLECLPPSHPSHPCADITP